MIGGGVRVGGCGWAHFWNVVKSRIVCCNFFVDGTWIWRAIGVVRAWWGGGGEAVYDTLVRTWGGESYLHVYNHYNHLIYNSSKWHFMKRWHLSLEITNSCSKDNWSNNLLYRIYICIYLVCIYEKKSVWRVKPRWFGVEVGDWYKMNVVWGNVVCGSL